MTIYEKFKAGVCTCLSIFLLTLGIESHRLVDHIGIWSTTPTKINATLDSFRGIAPEAITTLKTFDGIGPQTVVNLRTLQDATKSVEKQIVTSLKVTDELSDTLKLVNRPCGGLQACGTLADVDRTLSTVRNTFGQIEIAANHENRNLGTLDSQEAQIYQDFHATTVNLNALLASPDVKLFLKSSADTSVEVAAIAKDVHKEADSLTAPRPWYTKIPVYGSTVVNVACLISHSCPF